jgi:hypothetical protein
VYSTADWEPLVVPKWFSLTPNGTVPVGGQITLGLGLGEENPGGTYVSLSSDNPAFIVPSQLYVPPGHAGLQFTATVTANPTSRAARVTARWRGSLSTGDYQITGTSLPEPAPTATPTPFPDWRTPDTTLASGPASSPAVSGPVTFAFTSNEAGSTFLCQLTFEGEDLGARVPCTSPKTYSGLEAGAYRFAVSAVDPTGNIDPVPARRSFSIAATARPVPAAPAFSVPATLPVGLTTVNGTSEGGARVELIDRWAFNAPLWPANFWTGNASTDGGWSLVVEPLAEGCIGSAPVRPTRRAPRRGRRPSRWS